MEDTDHKMPPSLCPMCGYLSDHAASMHGRTKPPGPGDTVMCIACGQFMIIQPDMSKKPIDYETFKALDREHKAEMVRLKIMWLLLPADERREMRERGGKT